MQYISSIVFLICIVVGFGLFAKSLKEIYRNIMLGKAIDRSDRPSDRWKLMSEVALGQSKMGKRPVAAILHCFVYVGFIIINIELIEILVDGLFGTHRFLASVIGLSLYSYFTATLEVLALLVIIGVVAFFIRRNILHIKRLNMKNLNRFLLVAFLEGVSLQFPFFLPTYIQKAG